MRLILSNILGLVASLVGIYYFKQTDKRKICIASIVMSTIQIVAMSLIGAFASIATITINILRGILTYKNKLTKTNAIILLLIPYTFVILNFNSVFDLLPPIGSTLNMIGFFLIQKNKMAERRVLSLIASVAWTTYYFFVLNITSGLFEISYILVGITALKRELAVQKQIKE